MNVTGAEWRDLDPHEARYPLRNRSRRASESPAADEDDIVEIHGESTEETADGLDEFE
jgi:hypothetical protein